MLALSAVFLILCHAAVEDARSREAGDMHWFLVCAVGIALGLSDPGTRSVPLAAGSVLLTAYMLSQRLSGFRALPVLVAAAVLLMLPASHGDHRGISALLQFCLFAALYRLGALRGGADAKALMSVSLAFPAFPSHTELWSGAAGVPPSLCTALLALMFSLAWCVPVLVRSRRQGAPSLTCWRMPLDEAEGAHVWPVEDAVDGAVVRSPVGDDSADRISRLRGLGAKDVLVTPMVPFLVPIAVAFPISMLIGLMPVM